MAVIVQAQALTAPDPAMIQNPSYDMLLGGSVRAWLAPDSSRVAAVANRVSAVTDRSTAAVGYAQAAAGNQPLLTAGATPSGRNALTFVTGRQDKLVSVGALANVSGDFGLMAMIKPTAGTGTGGLALYTVTGGIHRAAIAMGGTNFARILPRGDGRWAAEVGVVGTIAQVTSAINLVTTGWQVAMLGWNATTKTAYLSYDGGATWLSATNASAPQPSNGDVTVGQDVTLTAGSAFDGMIGPAMALPFNPAAAANATALTNIQKWLAAAHSVGPLAA